MLASFDLELLPVGAYIVDPVGLVVAANKLALELLGTDLVGSDILRFYVDPPDLGKFHEQRRALEAQGRPIHDLRITFKVGTKLLEIEDHTRAFQTPEGSDLGMLCCIVDRTSEHRHKDLFERFPGGVYEFDRQDRLVKTNERLARLFGFASATALIDAGLMAEEVFKEARVAHELRRKIEEVGEVSNFRAELTSRDGSTFFASISASARRDENGTYAGQEGTLVDISEEERYARLIAGMPIGLYQLRWENGREVFDHCNAHFARLAGFETADQLLGLPMEQFHESAEGYRKMLAELEVQNEILDRTVTVRWHGDPNPRQAQVSTRVVGPAIEGAIRRVGASRDVTREVEQKELIEILSRDIGNTLHAYSAMLLQIRHTFDPLLEVFGVDPEKLALRDTSAPLADLLPAQDRLHQALLALLSLRQKGHPAGALNAGGWSSLENSSRVLDPAHFERANLPPEVRHAVLRDAALQVQSTLRRRKAGFLARKTVRATEEAAEDLARRASVTTLLLARAAVIEMGPQVRSLRDFIISRQPDPPEPKKRLEISALLRAAIAVHAEYANARGVELRLVPSERPVFVLGRERALVRVLENLLHNGIKYSWFSNYDFVSFNVELRTPGQVAVRVTNKGVPIAEDEREKVFEIGYRGRRSSEGLRTGSGIGLHDAQRVAREHGGKIEVKSRPFGAQDSAAAEPYFTTFTLTLPTTA
jgi:PAS domain S-box-containing protein